MSKARFVPVVLILVVLSIMGGAFGEQASSVTGPKANETVVFKMMPDIYPDTIVVSADDQHFAYAAERGNSSVVVVDGKQSSPYDLMWQSRISLSPDGGRAAYSATRQGKNFIVSNGTEGKHYERVGRLASSADGKHVAHTAVRGGKTVLVVDGVEDETWEDIGMLVYASTGDRLVYTAKRDGRWYVVDGGKTGEGYEEIGVGRGHTFFSPDGRHTAFPARFGRKWAAVVDGVKGEEYDRVESIVFSDDGKHLAYVAQDAEKRKVVLDGSAREVNGRIRSVTFAPGTAKLGYIETIDDEPILVIDSVPMKDNEGLEYFEMSRGGEHTALVITAKPESGVDTMATRGESTGGRYVVLDGKLSPEYDAIGQVHFSPDGKHLVYAARLGGWWKVFWDGQEIGQYEDILNRGQIGFSPSGQAVFAARRNENILWVEIGEQSGGVQSVSLPSAPAPVAKAAKLKLATMGGEAWAWHKEIRGDCSCGGCAQIEVAIAGRKSTARRDGNAFIAQVTLAEGENPVVISCRHADGKACASEKLVFTERLRDMPKAWLKISVAADGERVILSGKDSSSGEASRSPIVKYVWGEDGANPVKIGDAGFIPVSEQERVLPKPPTVDGEYYFSLKVIDARGRSDSARAYFVVKDGKPRQVNPNKENAAWIDNAVLYGTLPRLFGNSPFVGVTKKLDYLKELGVSAVWLAPSVQTANDSGYSITNYFKPREDFGTEAELRQLVNEAHKRGMKVMMDFVPNHSSIRHRYMRHAMSYGEASPYYNFYDRYEKTGSHTYYFGSWANLPNINYSNPEVQCWMTEAMSYWVREFGIDGYRIDAIWGVRQRNPEFAPKLRQELARIKPDILLVAEAGARDGYYFDHGYDAAYDWTDNLGNWSWNEVFKPEEGLVKRLTSALTNEGRGYHSDALLLRFLNNNDTGRPFVIRHGVGLTRAAAAMVLSLPGVPLVYSAEEVGTEYHPYQTATPISWDDKLGLREYYRKLIALHKDIPALHSRKWELLKVDSDQQVLSYLRYADAGETPVWVVLNFSEKPASARISPPTGATFRTWGGFKDLLSDEQVQVAQDPQGVGKVDLPPFSAKFLAVTEK